MTVLVLVIFFINHKLGVKEACFTVGGIHAVAINTTKTQKPQVKNVQIIILESLMNFTHLFVINFGLKLSITQM